MARIHRPPFVVLGFVLAFGTAACDGDANGAPAAPGGIDPWRVVLAPQDGDSPLDHDIAVTQRILQHDPSDLAQLDRLGQLFDVKARATADPGLYQVVLQCAACLEQRDPGGAAALLLRGHALHGMHRFAEAAEIAHRLVAVRGSMHDYGLLGDVLVDIGDIAGAGDAYQAMMDLRPCLQSYVRTAHVAWLRGNLEAARELTALATAAGSPRDPTALAWTHARMAFYELAAGDLETASLDCRVALRLQPDSAPAHLTFAYVLDAEGDVDAALEHARAAAGAVALPQYQWALADWLQATGRGIEADAVERVLEDAGAGEDPRTFALFLATRGRDGERARQLAEGELQQRQDLYTLDAQAWALHACGRSRDALAPMSRALEPGTTDPRLYLHAGAIHAALGDVAAAKASLQRADALRRLLLPGERALLQRLLTEI